MRNIAIIREGFSDYCVIKHFISAILQDDFVQLTDDNFLDMGKLTISDAVAKYFKSGGGNNLDDKKAIELKKRIIDVLYTAFKKFKREKDKVSNKDILAINSDAEKILKDKDNYFNKEFYILNEISQLAIEEFYNKMVKHGWAYENLPLILPLIFFPSSEILAASCIYDFKSESKNFRKLRAKPDLKLKVYETDNIPRAIETGKMEEVLSKFITPEAIEKVYKEIPEARKFIHILSCL
ncbi:MAG: hypothetical protein JRJ49_00255 [Deltaproteobacteria bacterium]|nr:hypothetical protein [Deltaproteobacteria bacterium]